jgi:hypothetical protein
VRLRQDQGFPCFESGKTVLTCFETVEASWQAICALVEIFCREQGYLNHYQIKLVETCLSLLRFVKTCWDLSRPVETCQDLLRLVKTCWDLSRPVETCQDLLRLFKTLGLIQYVNPLDKLFSTRGTRESREGMQKCQIHWCFLVWGYASTKRLRSTALDQDFQKTGLVSLSYVNNNISFLGPA